MDTCSIEALFKTAETFDTTRDMHVLERGPILDSLLLCLTEAGAGHGCLVLLAGEAGGGKTTVVQQLCESINGGARIVLGNCDPLSTPRPLGPLLDMAP